jgi:hypothetical protein
MEKGKQNKSDKLLEGLGSEKKKLKNYSSNVWRPNIPTNQGTQINEWIAQRSNPTIYTGSYQFNKLVIY